MVASELVKARMPLELKQRVKLRAERDMLSESAWLKRVIVSALQAGEDGQVEAPESGTGDAASARPTRPAGALGRYSSRVYVRLRSDDRLLLEARAAARGMRPATYVSVLTRCHLRRLAPLPKDELLAMRQSISELAAVGRNLNQIARRANEGGPLPGSGREGFLAMHKICLALHDHTKALLKRNLTSWESGFAEHL
ncbi:MAG: plasmid mobilization relaxosome protein MobC [Pseudomonadota bacterium]